jgi:large subunit ribosomal protein L19
MDNTQNQLKQNIDFRAGDTVRISYKIIEGNKVRIQPFEGIVISRKGTGPSQTFTVRKIGADLVGVERIFALLSPNIEKLEVVKRGDVRKAKLYYLRSKVGKAGRKVKEAKSTEERLASTVGTSDKPVQE